MTRPTFPALLPFIPLLAQTLCLAAPAAAACPLEIRCYPQKTLHS